MGRGQAWLEGEEALTGNRKIGCIGRGLDTALGEFLLNRFNDRTFTHRAGGVLQRRGRENIAELNAGLLEARRADVGDVVRNGCNVGLGTVKAGESGIE